MISDLSVKFAQDRISSQTSSKVRSALNMDKGDWLGTARYPEILFPENRYPEIVSSGNRHPETFHIVEVLV